MPDSAPPPGSNGSPASVWTMPLLLSAATVVGLVAALLGDGVWDALSWVGLALPVAAIATHVIRAGR